MLNAALTFFVSWLLLRKKSLSTGSGLFILLEAVAPVFSTLVALIAFHSKHLFLRFSAKDSKSSYRLPFGEEHYRQFMKYRENEVTHDSTLLRKNESLHEALQIEPYLDIIEGKDLDLKINAIGKLSVMRTRESIALLKLALNDEEYEVRYFATNSLTLLEKALIREIESHDQNIERYPADYQNYSLRGLAHLNMFYLGIIERSIAVVFLEKALNDFFYSLQLESSQHYLYVKILEVSTHQREFERVLSIAEDLASIAFLPPERVKIDFYIAEALYETGDFVKLEEVSKRLDVSAYKLPLMFDTLEYWGQR